MKDVLFFGSSHVGSLKTAYDQLPTPAPFNARFFCAPAADIAFTRVADRRIVPSVEGVIAADALGFFFAEGGANFQTLYLQQKRPLMDVGTQFLRTGKAAEIDLENVSTIFHVAGTSPWDFRRLGEHAAPLPRALRARLMEYLVGSKFTLKPQIDAIRRQLPHIRHMFIGTPLKFAEIRPLTATETEIVEEKRAHIASIANRYIFDDVFVPGEHLLEQNRLVTRREFFANGRQEAEVFQGGEKTKSDHHHANGVYGGQVLADFVLRHAQ
jgi:hypothetical protein